MAQASFDTRSATTGAPARADVEVVGKRVLATLVDTVVLGVVMLVVFVAQWVISLAFLGASAGLELSEGAQLAVGLVLSLLNIAVYVALFLGYYVYFEGRKGQTLGKMVVGIRVIREDNGGVPGTRAALVRTLLRVVDGFLGYLVGYLVASSSEKRQRLGDKAARTLVVATAGARDGGSARRHTRLHHHGDDDFFEEAFEDEESFGAGDDEIGDGWGDDSGSDFSDSGGGDSGGGDSGGSD